MINHQTFIRLLIQSPKDLIFNLVFRSTQQRVLKPYDPKIERTVSKLFAQISGISSKLQPVLIGSTGLKIHGEGDIDMLIPVAKKQFDHYSKALIKVFGQPTSANATMVQWKVKYQNLPLELDLIDVNSKRFKEQITIFNSLKSNVGLRKEYQLMKANYADKPNWLYQLIRMDFFNQIIRS